MFGFQRSHHLGALRKIDAGQSVALSGWVHRMRDHGGLIFIDLRDRFGITQLVVKPEAKAFLPRRKNYAPNGSFQLKARLRPAQKMRSMPICRRARSK